MITLSASEHELMQDVNKKEAAFSKRKFQREVEDVAKSQEIEKTDKELRPERQGGQ